MLEGGCRDQIRIGRPGHDAVEDGHSKEYGSEAEDNEIYNKTRPRANSPCCKSTWPFIRQQTGHDLDHVASARTAPIDWSAGPAGETGRSFSENWRY